MPDHNDNAPRQRLDKWLWYARIVKSRTLAQKLVAGGAVRVDSQRITSPDYRVSNGMVLTMNVHERVLVLRILDTGTRRGPATEARALYEDMSPQIPKPDRLDVPAPAAKREEGAGRPTKKERRETDRFKNNAE